MLDRQPAHARRLSPAYPPFTAAPHSPPTPPASRSPPAAPRRRPPPPAPTARAVVSRLPRLPRVRRSHDPRQLHAPTLHAPTSQSSPIRSPPHGTRNSYFGATAMPTRPTIPMRPVELGGWDPGRTARHPPIVTPGDPSRGRPSGGDARLGAGAARGHPAIRAGGRGGRSGRGSGRAACQRFAAGERTRARAHDAAGGRSLGAGAPARLACSPAGHLAGGPAPDEPGAGRSSAA